MVTFGLSAVFLFVTLVLGFLGLAKLWGLESAYVRSCWLPLGLFAAGIVLRRQLVETLSYAAMLAALWVFLISVAWALIGVVLLVSLRQRGQHPGGLGPATMLAAVPAVIFVFVLLWAFATGC